MNLVKVWIFSDFNNIVFKIAGVLFLFFFCLLVSIVFKLVGEVKFVIWDLRMLEVIVLFLNIFRVVYSFLKVFDEFFFG